MYFTLFLTVLLFFLGKFLWKVKTEGKWLGSHIHCSILIHLSYHFFFSFLLLKVNIYNLLILPLFRKYSTAWPIPQAAFLVMSSAFSVSACLLCNETNQGCAKFSERMHHQPLEYFIPLLNISQPHIFAF